jgi:hypothetical protein
MAAAAPSLLSHANLLLFSAMPPQARISLPLTAPGVAAIPCRTAFRRRGSRQQDLRGLRRDVLSSPLRASNKICCAWSRACSLSSKTLSASELDGNAKLRIMHGAR